TRRPSASLFFPYTTLFRSLVIRDILTVNDNARRRNRTGLLFQQLVVGGSNFLTGGKLGVLNLFDNLGRRAGIGSSLGYIFWRPGVVDLLLVSHQGLVHMPPRLSVASFSQWGHRSSRHGGVTFIGGWVLGIKEVQLADIDDQIACFDSVFHVFARLHRKVRAVWTREVFVE